MYSSQPRNKSLMNVPSFFSLYISIYPFLMDRYRFISEWFHAVLKIFLYLQAISVCSVPKEYMLHDPWTIKYQNCSFVYFNISVFCQSIEMVTELIIWLNMSYLCLVRAPMVESTIVMHKNCVNRKACDIPVVLFF